MVERCVGFVVSGDAVTVVDASVSNSAAEAIALVADDTWKLQKGERAQAYSVLHQRCADYLRENNVDRVVIKASAMPQSGGKVALLYSAEVRGVIGAAAASACGNVTFVAKGVISRTYGERKVDEYIADDDFWDGVTVGGKLRKTSREAAMLIIATRAE